MPDMNTNLNLRNALTSCAAQPAQAHVKPRLYGCFKLSSRSRFGTSARSPSGAQVRGQSASQPRPAHRMSPPDGKGTSDLTGG
jgi:hypothetical protein